MARVAGVDLPREKRGEVAITYIYGIGRSTARRILNRANMDPNKRVKAWSEDEVGRIRDIIERELKVEGDLRREVSMNVKRLMDIGCYRGIRHRRGLPVRGQRTHTNARTRPGLPPEPTLRRADGRGGRRAQGDGVRAQAGRGLRGWARGRPGGRHPLAPGRGARDHRDPRRDADPARRVPPAQAAAGVGGGHGAVPRREVPALPA